MSGSRSSWSEDWARIDELAAAVDAEEVSHIQVSVSVVVPETKADGLATRAQAAGASSSKTPLD
jgi:biotin synthase-related radical SAM superfamily protein